MQKQRSDCSQSAAVTICQFPRVNCNRISSVDTQEEQLSHCYCSSLYFCYLIYATGLLSSGAQPIPTLGLLGSRDPEAKKEGETCPSLTRSPLLLVKLMGSSRRSSEDLAICQSCQTPMLICGKFGGLLTSAAAFLSVVSDMWTPHLLLNVSPSILAD